MHRKFCPRLLPAALSAALGITATGAPFSALAQGMHNLEEVVVTAQRREQSLQDVSMSLTAFTGSALDQRVIEDASDLQFSVPNLLADSARITIRGVGNNAISSTAEGGLGYHINGVYLNTPLVRSSEYFDVERIEVLRGPQGTLYGRNTTAGVINILTRKPDESLSGEFTASVGNYNTRRAKGAVNFPITDNVYQRFAALVNKRDGYNTNLYTGNDVDGRDSYELRSSTRFEFTDNLSSDLILYYLNEDSNRANETKGTCTKDAVTGCSALSAGFGTPDVSGSIFQTLNLAFLGGTLMPAGDYFANANNPSEYRTVNIDQEPTFEAEQLGASLEFNYSSDYYTFTSLTGYFKTETDVFQDFDRFATDVELFRPVTYKANAKDVTTTTMIQSGRRDIGEAEQFTQEFRVASQFDGKYNFLLGAFYFDEERSNQALITHPALAATQQALGLPEEFEWFNIESDPITSESLALFGEFYVDFTEQTRLTTGLRYTDDDKSVRTRQQFLVLTDPSWVESEDSWKETTGKITVEHFLNEDSMVFATAGRGYKAGGLNPGGPQGGAVFEPEYINMLEVGSKNTFMDGRLVANFGAFFYDYEGLQIGQVSETSAVTVNADATIAGAEGEFNFAITESLLADFSLSWLDVDINDFESADEGDPNGIAPGTVPAVDANGNIRYTDAGLLIKNLDGNALRNAPEYSAKLGLSYSMPVFDGYEMTARMDYFWQDQYFANEFNKPSDVIDSWTQADLQLMLTPSAQNWYVKLYAKNVTDENDVTRRGQDGPLVGRFRSVTVLEPRTYGIELNYLFD